MNSKELVKLPQIDTQVARTLEWLEDIPKLATAKIKEDPKYVMGLIKQTELIEIAAKKAKISEVTHTASIAKMNMIRVVGKFLCDSEVHKNKGASATKLLPSLGISKDESSKYQRVARITSYHWTYVLSHSPNINAALREYDRYEKLKVVLVNNKIKEAEQESMLKTFVLGGLSPFMAECQIKNANSKEEEEEEEAEADEKEEEEDRPIRKDRLDSNISMLAKNVVDINNYLDNLAKFIHATKELSAEQYKTIVKNVKSLNESMSDVNEMTKQLKSRITGAKHQKE